jgi:outer membrane protein assembly factor BamA
MVLRRILLLLTFCVPISVFTAAAQAPSSHASRPPTVVRSTQLVKLKDSSYVVIHNIIVLGNRRTRDAIILRDFDLKPGDTLFYDDAMQVLEDKRQQLINTSLFLTVNVYFSGWSGKHTNITVEVLERWYTFGFPIFSLADRNFNQWWVAEKHSLGRVNYGFTFYENNLTGKNDQLILTVQGGYTDHFSLNYNLPYFDRSLKSGLGFSIGYSTTKELGYITDFNKLQFLSQPQVVNEQFAAGITYTYRKAIRFKHQISLNYYYTRLSDTILKLNPSYFPPSGRTQRYLQLVYRFSYIGADDWAYPLKGFNFYGQVSREGFGNPNSVNITELYFQSAKYWKLLPSTYFALGLHGRVQIPIPQPYFLSTGMGYQEDYLRGLEYYVVDGSSFGILKADLKQQLFSLHLHFPFLPAQFETIPFRVFFKIFGDMGYAFNTYPGNSFLNNRLLYTEGFGLDIVTYYDLRIRLEYSFNQLGQKGLFLHSKSEF